MYITDHGGEVVTLDRYLGIELRGLNKLSHSLILVDVDLEVDRCLLLADSKDVVGKEREVSVLAVLGYCVVTLVVVVLVDIILNVIHELRYEALALSAIRCNLAI